MDRSVFVKLAGTTNLVNNKGTICFRTCCVSCKNEVLEVINNNDDSDVDGGGGGGDY